MSDYKRDLFGFNSKKARAFMLKNESFFFKGSRMLLDPYNGQMIKADVERWDIEHIFPLSSAWDAGFNKMYRDSPTHAIKQMKAFSNDLHNLIPTSSSSNRSRGAKTLWNWAPLNLKYIPRRNAIVRDLAADYGLHLSKTQLWAMEWSNTKILVKHQHGIHLGKARAWLIQKGFYKFLMPF